MKAVLTAMSLAAAAGLASAQTAPPEPGPPPMGGHEHARFDLDANHDGYLTRAEAMAAADARFKRLDKDGDGKLTRDELTRHGPPDGRWAHGAKGPGGAGAEGGPPPPGPQAGAAAGPDDERAAPFRMMMRAHMMLQMQRREAGERRLADNLFDEYDRNHDGAIELTEFRAQAMARFNALDGNHDGKIKLPEHKGPRAGEGHRGQRGGWRHGGPEGAPPGEPAAPMPPKTP